MTTSTQTGTVRLPTAGSKVRCPADRGDEAYDGVAEAIAETVSHNHLGHPFHWVDVRHPRGHIVVWPSNRLEF